MVAYKFVTIFCFLIVSIWSSLSVYFFSLSYGLPSFLFLKGFHIDLFIAFWIVSLCIALIFIGLAITIHKCEL